MRFLLIFFCISILVPGYYSYAAEYIFEVQWAVEATADVEIAGYRLYDLQQNTICETADPAATSIVCAADIPGSEATFTLVSYSTTGVESDPSDPFTIVFGATEPLTAMFTFTTTEGSLAVDLDATASTGTITHYSWDFSDGSTDNTVTTRHTFPAAGTYTISLTVQDGSGAESTTSQVVTVRETVGENQPPTAALVITSAAPAGDAPLTVDFDGSESTDPENQPLTFFWDFGDGATTSDGAQTSHQYITAGTYTTTLTVTDSQGASNSMTSQPILVTSDASGSGATATAVITASSNAGPPPLVVTFTGLDSTPSEQTGAITGYSWNFGDGSTGSGAETGHSFKEPGTYTVQLTVTDSFGKTATTTTTVDVSTPGAQNVAPILIQIYKLLLLNK